MACEIKTWIGGEMGLTIDDVDRLYDAARAEGFLNVVAFERSGPVSRQDFRNFVAHNDVFFAAGYDEDKRPLGWFHLTGLEGRTARIHFCFFEAGKPDRIELGRLALDYCFRVFGLESVVGAVPSINPGAADYARALGGRELGIVPSMCWIARLKRAVGGLMFVFTPNGGE